MGKIFALNKISVLTKDRLCARGQVRQHFDFKIFVIKFCWIERRFISIAQLVLRIFLKKCPRRLPLHCKLHRRLRCYHFCIIKNMAYKNYTYFFFFNDDWHMTITKYQNLIILRAKRALFQSNYLKKFIITLHKKVF